jgi:hypothetical protein
MESKPMASPELPTFWEPTISLPAASAGRISADPFHATFCSRNNSFLRFSTFDSSNYLHRPFVISLHRFLESRFPSGRSPATAVSNTRSALQGDRVARIGQNLQGAMDIILEIVDTLVLDRAYATLFPASPAQTLYYKLNNATTSTFSSLREGATPAPQYSYIFEPASRIISLNPTEWAYKSSLPRDNVFRQSFSLFAIVW